MIIDFFRVTPKTRKVKLNKKSGILFSNPSFLKKIIFYTASNLLIVSVLYLGYLYWPLVKAVSYYNLYKDTNTTQTVTAKPTIQPEKYFEYSITIPKIFAYSKIIENVSPYNPGEYLKVLDENVVAQANSSSMPGSGVGHSIYIFAHSTQQGISRVRKNTVFYLLGELNNQDEVFINRGGKLFTYKVYKQQVVNANQVQYVTYTEPTKEILILQTCWPIGTDWKRLLIFAELVDK